MNELDCSMWEMIMLLSHEVASQWKPDRQKEIKFNFATCTIIFLISTVTNLTSSIEISY
jgi:hypothetical protein